MKARRVLMVASAGGLALTTVLAGPAFGQSKSYGDATKDITRFGGAKFSVADIKSLRITHGKTHFTAVVKFKNLTRDNWTSIYVGSQANDPLSYADIAMTVRRGGGPYSGKVWLAGDGGAAPHCDAKVTTKYGKNGWVSFSAPRHCFTDPRGKLPRKIRSYASVHRTNAINSVGAFDYAPYGTFTKWAKKG